MANFSKPATLSPVKVSLTFGRYLFAGVSKTKKQSKKWVVFVPESDSEFMPAHRRDLEKLVGRRAASSVNFLVINKPGQHIDHVDPKVFERSFRRQRRIDDAVRAIQQVVPEGHSIHIVGYSEGAYLAPQVALRDKRVRTVTMIGGGTRGWLKEELNTARATEKRDYERAIRKIHRNPNSSEVWNGFSFATWYSYRGDNTLQALRKLKIPMLAILGARDRVIDLKSTIFDLVLISERKDVEIHIFGDCGHQFTRHWHPVSKILGRYLLERFKHG